MSSEVSDETAFPRASWRVRLVAVVGRVDGWEALGKAVSAETEPRSAAEPNISSLSRQISQHCLRVPPSPIGEDN